MNHLHLKIRLLVLRQRCLSLENRLHYLLYSLSLQSHLLIIQQELLFQIRIQHLCYHPQLWHVELQCTLLHHFTEHFQELTMDLPAHPTQVVHIEGLRWINQNSQYCKLFHMQHLWPNTLAVLLR